MGSVNPQGVAKYRCEISDDTTDQQSGQKNYFLLDKDIILRIQRLLNETTIMASPQSLEGVSKGVNYILKIEDVYQSATYVWCEKPPKGWEKLQEFVDILLGIAHERV